MIRDLNELSNKSIAVLGLGKTGISVANFLVNHIDALNITILESKQESESYNTESTKISAQVTVVFNQTCIDKNHNFDYIVISPGLKPNSLMMRSIQDTELPYLTDLDLFILKLKTYDSASKQKYLAATGTNGKTTIVSLLAHLYDTQAIGNIGTPMLEYFNSQSKTIRSNAVPVLELSSFQLFYTKQYILNLLAPQSAIFSNFTADHLDWHQDFDEYFDAKAKLFIENSEELSIINHDDKLLQTKFRNTNHQLACFSTETQLKELTEFYTHKPQIVSILENQYIYIYILKGDKYNPIKLMNAEDLLIKGKHNIANTMAVAIAFLKDHLGQIYNSDNVINYKFLDVLQSKLSSFKPVAHRLEFVAHRHNKAFYNDSKATNPDAAIKSIEAFEKPIVIIGGKNKHLDLTDFCNFLVSSAYAVICIGELKDYFMENLTCRMPARRVFKADSMEQAIKTSIQIDGSGYVLLAPASSSFDMFKSFEDRGNQFRDSVLELNNTNK